MTESLALVDIHQVRWTHNAIYDHFKDGRSIFETVVELLTGNLKLSALPPLQLVKKGKQLYSLSNRRLFVLRKYAHILKKFGHLHEKSPVSVPIAFTDAHHGDAFTTGTGGLQVQLLRPLQKPTFQPRQWGPTCAPSARSLSRDARSHSRGRSLSVGRWAEATEAGRGAATGRRASFGRVEYRFVLEDIEEIPPAGMAAVAPSSGRPRSPSPKAKAAATEVKPKAVAKEVKPKAVAKEVKPKAVAKDMKPKVAKDVEDHMPDALKDIGPCVSEAQGFPVLPQSKRSKKELEVEKLLKDLQRYVARLETQVEDSQRVGTIAAWEERTFTSHALGGSSHVQGPARVGDGDVEGGAGPSGPSGPSRDGATLLLSTLSPDGSLGAQLVVDGKPRLQLVDPIVGRVLYTCEDLLVGSELSQSLQFLDYRLLLSGPAGVTCFDLKSKAVQHMPMPMPMPYGACGFMVLCSVAMFLGPEALRLYLSRGRLQRPGVRHRVWLVLCWMSSWKVWLEQRLSAYSAYLWYPELYDQLLAQKLRKKRLLRSQAGTGFRRVTGSGRATGSTRDDVRRGAFESAMALCIRVALPSGRTADVPLEREATLGDLKTAAQRQLQAGVLRLMHPSSGELLDLAQSVEAAGLAPEATVLAIAQPMQLSATKFSFALRCGGRVVAWGAPRDGGDCSRVQHQLREVEHLEGSDRSFSARLSSGQTVAWGGLECSTRTQERFGRRMARCELCREGEHKELQDTLAAAQQIYDTDTAHAALMPNGGVLAWGDPERGGRAPRAKAVAATVHAFAAILRDDTVLAWGDEAYGGRLNVELREVEKLQATSKAFAALSTESGPFWEGKRGWLEFGSAKHGGEISETIQEQLREVRHLASTSSAFCALTADGRLVCWGSAAHGGAGPGPAATGRAVAVAASAESMEPASAEQAEAEVESVDKKRLEEEPDLGLSQDGRRADHGTAADEMAQRRSSSVPFRSLCSEPESPAPHSESYVARLGPRVAENFLWPIEMPDTTVGSLGHPEVCGRFCIRFVYGNCVKGPSCEFCHLEHKENKVKMDKAQRLLFETLNEAAVLALLLPQFEKRCEKQGMTLGRRVLLFFQPQEDKSDW
eukprot:g26798.t2